MKPNKAQQEVVSTIDGPVLCLAIAGAGKTRSLVERVKAMLKSPDHHIDPENILCLTFTDVGAKEMRERLIADVGVEAYAIDIKTFHAFCSDVIKDNSDYFRLKELDVVSELEVIEIMEEIIDELPAKSSLVRLRGDKYWEVGRLKSLFGLMKQENWTFEVIEKHCAESMSIITEANNYLDKVRDMADDDRKVFYKEFIEINNHLKPLIYSRNGKGYKVGLLKDKEIDKIKSGINTLLEAAKLLDVYDAKMAERGRYDYQDMLQWTIKMFQNDPDKLADYQEKYQYIIIDEMQDTSGAQHFIVDLLLDFWEKPNVLAVGDADQTLFSFAGSRIQNINDFKDRYNPKVINMDQNYRSNQKILDHAANLIKPHSGSIKKDGWMHAALETEGDVFACEFENLKSETTFVYQKIKDLIKAGINPSEIAVIYRKHSHAEDLMKVLNNDGIPVMAKRKINILDEVLVKQILTVLEYVDLCNRGIDPGGILSEVLHYNFMEVPQGLLHAHLLDPEKKDDFILSAEVFLQGLVKDSMNKPPLLLVNDIIYNTSLHETILNGKDKQGAAVITTLFNWIREEQLRNPDLTVRSLLGYIRRMRSNDITIDIENIAYGTDGVNFATTHGAKGAEFQHVFMIRCTRDQWESGRGGGGNYKFPETLTKADKDEEEKNQRRLFYVAMTRAKKYLYVCYSSADDNDKKLEPSKFITEAKLEAESIDVSEGSLDYIMKCLVPEKIDFSIITDCLHRTLLNT
jgi:DNA helicase-2/ATP-dependent DNA helicase PcrA